MMQAITLKAKNSEAIAALGAIRTAVKEYRVEYGAYPPVSFNLTDSNNPLSQYIKASDLGGIYYSGGCYEFHLTGSMPPGPTYYVGCLTWQSSAPKASEVNQQGSGALEIRMYEDGTIEYHIPQLMP